MRSGLAFRLSGIDEGGTASPNKAPLRPHCALCPDNRQLGSDPRLSRLERDDLSNQIFIFLNREQADGHRQLEAPRPATARIEIQHALLLIESGLMRVTK